VYVFVRTWWIWTTLREKRFDAKFVGKRIFQNVEIIDALQLSFQYQSIVRKKFYIMWSFGWETLKGSDYFRIQNLSFNAPRELNLMFYEANCLRVVCFSCCWLLFCRFFLFSFSHFLLLNTSLLLTKWILKQSNFVNSIFRKYHISKNQSLKIMLLFLPKRKILLGVNLTGISA
jgi:hypothetical protein